MNKKQQKIHGMYIEILVLQKKLSVI